MISPKREQALLEAILRHQVGVDPDAAAEVLDLVAVGIVNTAWRNSPLEDWHAAGRLHDGEMLRVNAHTTWRVRQIVRRWRGQVGLDPRSRIDALDTLEVDDVDHLAVRVWRWLVKPNRRLPMGVTFAEEAGSDLGEYNEHADSVPGGFAATAEHLGPRHAFWRAAAHGGLACRHWWGTPTWPPLVDRFLHALDNPSDPHWGRDGAFKARLPAEPAQIRDRVQLRRVLLGRPWTLDSDVARWIVHAGMGFLQTTVLSVPEIDQL